MLKAGGASQGVQACRGVVPPIVPWQGLWTPSLALYSCQCVLPACARWNDGRGYGSVCSCILGFAVWCMHVCRDIAAYRTVLGPLLAEARLTHSLHRAGYIAQLSRFAIFKLE